MATLRQRLSMSPTKVGSALANAIVISESSQDSSSSDTTTPSSHLQDSQEPDEEFDPALGTQTIGSEGAAIQEELADIIDAPGATDVDMLHHEHNSARSKHSSFPTPSTAPLAHDDEDLADYETTPPRGHKIASMAHVPAGDEDGEGVRTDDEALSPEDHDGANGANTSFSSDGSIGTTCKTTTVITTLLSDPSVPLTYEEVLPLCESKASTTGSNTASYIITSRHFNPEDPAHQCKLIADTAKHGQKKGFTQGIRTKIHPLMGRNKIVEVVWADTEDFRHAKRLGFRIYWKGIPFTAQSWGPALDCRSRVIKVHLPPGDDPDSYRTAFITSCSHELTITHMWIVGTAPEDESEDPTYGGILIAVVKFANDGRRAGKSLNWDELCRIPGYTFFAGKAYENKFAGQILRCRNCRHRADFVHTIDECPAPYCKGCHKNHLIGECGYQSSAPPNAPSRASAAPTSSSSASGTYSNLRPASTTAASAVAPPTRSNAIAGPSRIVAPLPTGTAPTSAPQGSYGHYIANHPSKAPPPPRTPKGKGKATQSSAAATPESFAAFFSPKRAAPTELETSPPHKLARGGPKSGALAPIEGLA
ncbi:hypothetical protein CF326_g4655 [Tilletia indica]|nr:hypothetical protein CF326_g4655 [Tilletia indica]